METLDDLHTIDDSLRSIHVDDGRRLKPLLLDKMFNRATQWKGSSPQIRPIIRPPSPPRRPTVFPLPQPLPAQEKISPLGGLFDYPELLPLVLREFDQTRDLVILARVNKAFCKLVQRKLYAHVWVRPCTSALDPTYRS